LPLQKNIFAENVRIFFARYYLSENPGGLVLSIKRLFQ